MERLRMIVVDDHPFVIEGIKISLMGVEDIEITGQASDSEELFSMLEKPYPDLILLDITLPGLSGIEVARILTARYSSIKVIMISANADQESILSSLGAGAKGYLTKNTGSEELVKAVRTVAGGADYLGESISRGIVAEYLSRARSGQSYEEKGSGKLSDREKGIVRLIAEGLTYKEVGDRLCISARTVEAHRNNIMNKLELKTTADLIKYSIREGITTL